MPGAGLIDVAVRLEIVSRLQRRSEVLQPEMDPTVRAKDAC